MFILLNWFNHSFFISTNLRLNKNITIYSPKGYDRDRLHNWRPTRTLWQQFIDNYLDENRQFVSRNSYLKWSKSAARWNRLQLAFAQIRAHILVQCRSDFAPLGQRCDFLRPVFSSFDPGRAETSCAESSQMEWLYILLGIQGNKSTVLVHFESYRVTACSHAWPI